MRKIPRRYSHFLYGVIQSGLTCAVSAGIASLSFIADGGFARHWCSLWLLSWAAMLPVVLFAAPFIRRFTERLTSTS